MINIVLDMPKVTLDINSFKALASDTRLNILKALDGKKMNLKDLSNATNLNKATLHEHLTKLTEAGIVKRKEREGHKWVYYKLTWKGEGLLHPENTRIVVLFSATFIALAAGITQFINYLKFRTSSLSMGSSEHGFTLDNDVTPLAPDFNKGASEGINDTILDNASRIATEWTDYGINGATSFSQDPIFLYIAIACFIVFILVLSIAIWRYKKNKTPKL